MAMTPDTTPRAFPAASTDAHRRALDDSARLQALDRSGLMDSAPEPVFDRAARLASRILGVPVVLFSLVDAQRQFFKAQAGLAEPRETPLSHSFCQYVVSEDRALAVNDARNHPLLSDNGAVHDLDVIAYLGVPVHGPDGAVLGSFCAIDSQPHDWTEAQLADLRDLAAIVETELALNRTLTERQVLIDELNHRVKNLFAVTAGIVRMSQQAGEPSSALQGRLRALSEAHALITPAIHADRPAEAETTLHALIGTLLAPHDTGAGRIRLGGDDVTVAPRAATPLSLAFYELITNAVKYGALTGPDGVLSVTCRLQDDWLVLDWHETAVAPEAGTRSGFGSKLVSMTLEAQLRGSVETTRDGDTLRRVVRLPLASLTF
ncbi:GAF domain-containing protein [Cereibacter sphaeroides]|nr:GAF domain-containing protein [Cereibacter sphaeroides]